MTEPSNPAQTPAPAPGSPSPLYQPETSPAPPAGAQPPSPPGAQPPSPPGTAPGHQPGTAPAYPGGASPYPPGIQPAYPAAGLPGQPGAYPTSAVPASAMPASAMPMSAYPVYVSPPSRVSPWIWVLAAVSFVLLLATSGLGLAFLGGQDRISELEQTVASLEDEGDDLRADLEDAQACLDAFDDWWAAPIGRDEDEWAAVIDACR